ncbi:CRISPR-associated protein Cas4 [uncultured Desulfobacter sp.]|nr:CRISPR-associated protein Cas4 [uncultured Desulfobacter sp.]
MKALDYTGTQVNYFFVCRRKLWLFTRDIRFENENEYVQLGRLIDEYSYTRKKKQIEIGNIKIDFLDNKQGIIHEVKKSRKIEKAHIWQVKYYLYWLKFHGIEHITGEIDYPKLKKKEVISLTEKDLEAFEDIFTQMKTILDRDLPPETINRPFCKKCAYFE